MGDERLLITGGLVVDTDSGHATHADLLIARGRIAAIGAPGSLAGAAAR